MLWHTIFASTSFFIATTRILAKLDDPKRKAIKPSKPSHEKIEIAATEAGEHVQKIIAEHGEKGKVPALNRWLTFLEKAAQIIILEVPDDLNAFVMFETLNDRGVKTTQADMLKNYLVGEAHDRRNEAQQKWSAMKALLEVGDSEDIVVSYLRHFLVVRHNAIRDKEVYSKIKSTVNGPSGSLASPVAIILAAATLGVTHREEPCPAVGRIRFAR